MAHEGRYTFEVQAQQCPTCIYKKDQQSMLAGLEAEIADPKMPGFFVSYRVCHHARRDAQTCCRGFWERHKDHCMLGQLAQRLGLVRFVKDGCYDL